MADHKNQHFVPRCALKPFSLGGKGKAINLYAFEQNLLIPNAPVKSQCARDYMYGANGKIEESLANIEKMYGSARDRVIKREDTDEDRKLLRFFAYLQLKRTQIAIERLQKAEGAFFKDIFGDEAPEEPPLAYFMVQSLKVCLETSPLIEDLKIRVVENNTSVEFVTSDDPAIMTNKFHTQKENIGGFGMSSSGLILFMPITPKLGVLCYDGLVYTISNAVAGRIVLNKSSDADALNELHFLKVTRPIGPVTVHVSAPSARRI